MTDRLLDRKQLTRAFTALATKLKKQGVIGEVHVFGGAAMMLAFNAREATRDIDSLFAPSKIMAQ